MKDWTYPRDGPCFRTIGLHYFCRFRQYKQFESTLPRIRGLNYFRSHRSHTSRIQNYFPSSKLAIGCVGCLVALFGLGAFVVVHKQSDLAKETPKSIVLHDVADGNYIPFIELLRAGPFRSAKSLLGMVQHRIL